MKLRDGEEHCRQAVWPVQLMGAIVRRVSAAGDTLHPTQLPLHHYILANVLALDMEHRLMGASALADGTTDQGCAFSLRNCVAK